MSMNGGEATERPKVLLVDDDDSTRLALERGLARAGCEVLHASDGEQGLKVLQERPVQVVFLDLRMPGIDGHTFLRRLKSHNTTARVVVVSGQGNMEDVVDVLRCGVVDYLRKPWTQSDLIGAYNRALEGLEAAAVAHPAVLQVVSYAAPPPSPPPVAVAAAPPRIMQAAPAALTQTPTRPEVQAERAPIADNKPRSVDGFAAVIERLKSGEVPLPPAPLIITKMRQMLNSPQIDASGVAGLVSQDQRLAAEVLRLANTAHYARAGRTADLQTAVTRIGFRQMHQIVETILLRSAFEANLPWTRQALRDIWRRSVATALAAKALCEVSPPAKRVDPHLTYLAALFMDVGASFLVWVADEICGRTGQPLDREGMAHSTAAHHRAVGRRVLESWNMDPVVQLVANSHHGDPGPATGVGMYKALISAGTLVVEHLQLPPDMTTIGLPLTDEGSRKLLTSLGLSPPDLARAATAIKPEFETITS